MNFIISRFSKDNFWNLIVYFGIVLTVLVAEQNGSALLLISSFTVVPYILTRFNKVKYLANGTCTNSQGDDLSNKPAVLAFVIIMLNFILCVFGDVAGWLSFLSSIPQPFKFTAFTCCIMFCPFMYFIIANCPISILFNIDSWIGRSSSASGHLNSSEAHSTLHNRPMNNVHAHSPSRNDLITNPSYSYLPQNVYHSNNSRHY